MRDYYGRPVVALLKNWVLDRLDELEEAIGDGDEQTAYEIVLDLREQVETAIEE